MLKTRRALLARCAAAVWVLASAAGIASAQITVSANPINFGNVGLGLVVTHALDISNTGSTSVTLESYTFDQPTIFGVYDSAIPVVISPGQVLKYSFAFRPAAAQTYTGTLTLNFTGAPNYVETLEGTGITTTANPQLSTTSIAFGSVPLGTTVSQNVTVTNEGSDSVEITDLKSYSPYVATGWTKTVTLNQNQTFNFTVSYTPITTGYSTGSVTVDFDTVPSMGIAMTGTGIAPTSLAVTSSPNLPPATQGFDYKTVLLATGGTPPYTWQLQGTLPTGLAFNSSGGDLTGTVSSSAGTQSYSLTATVQDSSRPHLQATQSITLAVDAPTGANCSVDSVDGSRSSKPLVALNDLGTGYYQGYEGGLYPGGINTDPPSHHTPAVTIGEGIQPLDPDGTPDPVNGKMVFISLGQSTTQQPFLDFIDIANADPDKNPQLVIVQGALGGGTANLWSESDSPYLATVLDYILPFAGVTPNQVVAAWVNAEDSLSDSFPGDATTLQGQLETFAQELHTNFPNLVLSYWGSLNYTGYSDGVDSVDPEPQGYESAFGVKWAIADQVNGDHSLNFQPSKGPVEAPWMGWGDYYWANGLNTRQDGTYWSCHDLGDDGLHPSNVGHYKIVEGLLNLLKTGDTSSPWFLAPAAKRVPASR